MKKILLIRAPCYIPYHLYSDVPVAEWGSVDYDSALRVEDVPNPDCRRETTHCEHVVQCQGLAAAISAGDGRLATRDSVLPSCVDLIDKCMVHPEDWITDTRPDVQHDTTDTVVAIAVRAARGC